jgi:hypothetical protein
MSVKTPSRVSIVAASSGLVRWETFNGKEHLVVPIVAMIGDEVFHPMGSKGPAFVPADVLAAWPSIWNDTIVMLDHPEGATAVSTPDYIEGFGLGRIYNARFENNRLQMEEWLDPERAELIGGEALKQFEALKAGKKIEVSFAPYVVDEYAPGTSASGKPYEYIWRLIVGCDHVANLPFGVLGACSNEMGCGAPMTARENENQKEVSMPDPPQKAKAKSRISFSSIAGSIAEFFKGGGTNAAANGTVTAAETGTGDLALWSTMYDVLKSTVPAFHGIVEIYHETENSGYVVYHVQLSNYNTDWLFNVKLEQRSFSVELSTGIITLGSDAVEVKPGPTTYVPVEEPVKVEAASNETPCQCQKTPNASTSNETLAQPEESTMTDEEIKALVDGSVKTAVESAVTAATANLLTKTDIAPLLAAAQAQEASATTRKAELVAELVSACQTPGMPQFSEDDLKALELPILEKMAASFLAPVESANASLAVNYAAMGLPRKPIAATSTTKKNLPPLPDPHGVNKFLIPTETTSETEN